MNTSGFIKRPGRRIVAAVLATLVGMHESRAQTSAPIFPEGWDRSVRDRMFMRIGPIYVNAKTTSSDAVDATGPVMSVAQLQRTGAWLQTATTSEVRALTGSRLTVGDWRTIFGALLGTPDVPTLVPEVLSGQGLGTPPGIKASLGDASTAALSMGYWLTEDEAWAVEAFVMGKPLDIKAYGKGMAPAAEVSDLGDRVPGPNGLSGKHILSLKMLPLSMVLTRHFGSPHNMIRPFVGLGGIYAFIYDGKTTAAYDVYVGGKSTVHAKNTFGVGPFVGLTGKIDDVFSINFQVGQVNLRSEAYLTTRNTIITSQSGVLNDFSPQLVTAADLVLDRDPQHFLTGMSKLVMAHGESAARADLGTFSRRQTQKVRATMFNLSIGYKF